MTKVPFDRWQDLKRRGNPTVAEIDAIDKDTRWSPREPDWWCEMMKVKKKILAATS
jgi:hypothetical protein